MEPKTILCYGDSNTYGFDPRDPLGGRYDESVRWCDQLEKLTGWQVINEGSNGRTIPAWGVEKKEYRALLKKYKTPDLLFIMLGTNDALQLFTAPQILKRMEDLLDITREEYPQVPILLLAPPSVTMPDEKLQKTVAELDDLYENLAMQRGLAFEKTSTWGASLACDGVHLSEEGHKTFAKHMAQILEKI